MARFFKVLALAFVAVILFGLLEVKGMSNTSTQWKDLFQGVVMVDPDFVSVAGGDLDLVNSDVQIVLNDYDRTLQLRGDFGNGHLGGSVIDVASNKKIGTWYLDAAPEGQRFDGNMEIPGEPWTHRFSFARP